ncbi:beta-lactamase/transpeptidase-like protein [Auricularia subglabra TFB-10046 SS5]|uniref:Beta-lactamase/transpeptidase-like protein n=1 Tax=Auricularia subglabra (strain TFB-10046 / SS5) TaxID=717982 RepID=J0DAF8_AURST|nr:beta-lactamase/transpeptidase-like protein [Auricularia subglabra TFB-10046 SS5]
MHSLTAFLLATAALGLAAPPRSSHELREHLAKLPRDLLLSTRIPARHAARASGTLITAEYAEFVTNAMEHWDVKGATVALVRSTGNGTFDVDTRAFGVRNAAGDPMTTTTLQPVGSLSKHFTAASVGLLAADLSNNFTLHTPWRDVLPEFGLQDPVADAGADAFDALTHRTGMPRHDGILVHDGEDTDFSAEVMKYLKPSNPFRSVWQYSNHMYNTGASLVSRLAGEPYPDFVQRNILDKVGMNLTTYDFVDAVQSGKMENGFWRQGENLTSPGVLQATNGPPAKSLGGIAGSGGVITTCEDMALWLQVLLNGGVNPATGEVVIPADVLTTMSTGVSVESGVASFPEMAPIVYGLGFERSAYQGHEWVGHDGSYYGFMAQLVTFPNDGVGIVVMTNDSPRGYYLHNSALWRAAEDLLKMPLHVDWVSRFDAINEGSLQADAEAAASALPPPANATEPDAPPAALAGCYSDPAYGNVTLVLSTDGTTLSSPAPRFGRGTVLNLMHYDGNIFNATLALFLPNLDESRLLLRQLQALPAEFGFDESGHVEGFGLTGDLWGAAPGTPGPSGSTAKERAETSQAENNAIFVWRD